MAFVLISQFSTIWNSLSHKFLLPLTRQRSQGHSKTRMAGKVSQFRAATDDLSPEVWLGHVLPLGVESLLRVGAVVDYLQLARLVVVTVPGTPV